MSAAERCAWPGADAAMIAYHDEVWGVPERDDRALFEKLVLDGFQAGLSWRTILAKRENFVKAFDGFEPAKIARWDKRRIERLMADAGIVRNRRKIEAAVKNARGYLAIRDETGSFADYIWQFTGGRTLANEFRDMSDIPAETPESRAMSKDLKSRGFGFVGPTICYAFMQATGMVNDHVVSCFRHGELG